MHILKKFPSRAITIGLYAILFTPLVFAQSFIYPFVVPKVFVFQALAGAVFVLWLFLAVQFPEYRVRRSEVLLVVGGLLAWLFITALLGVDLERSLWSNQERAIGLVALLHFVGLFFVLSARKGFVAWEQYFTVSFGVSFIAAFFSFLVSAGLLSQRFFFEEFTPRPGSFLGNPTFLAAYLIPHIFLALWFAARERKSSPRIAALWVFGAFFLVADVFLTQTRGAILGIGAGFLSLVLWGALRGVNVPEIGRMSVRAVCRGVLVLFVVSGTVFWSTRAAPVWQKVPGVSRLATISVSSPDLQPRLIALKIAWDAFLARPFVGYGLENFKYPFDTRYDPQLLRAGFSETYFDKPHNIFAEYLVTSGVPGLLLYVLLLALLVHRLFVSVGLAGFAPFGVALLTAHTVQNGFAFETFGSLLLFFVIAAFVDREGADRGDASPGGGPHRPWTGLQQSALYGFGAITIIALLFMNSTILFANNRQYWVLNYFLNRKPALAAESFEAAVRAPFTPYRGEIRRDFALSLSQVYTQGLEIEDVNQMVSRSMGELEAAIRARPNDYFLLVSWADAATVLWVFEPGYLKTARAYLERALVLSPRRQQNYYVLAKIEFLEGRSQAAFETIKKAVDLDPEVGDPHFYYALLAFEAGKRDVGFSELELARRLGREPKNAREYALFGNYYGDAGRYPEAIQFYEQALLRDPDDLESRLKLGIVHFYVGNNSVAKEYISEVMRRTDLTKAPSYPQLKEILDVLGL